LGRAKQPSWKQREVVEAAQGGQAEAKRAEATAKRAVTAQCKHQKELEAAAKATAKARRQEKRAAQAKMAEQAATKRAAKEAGDDGL
jgi:hypothetical protein